MNMRSNENERKRILIIGASVLQLPAIQKAKEMGLYVGVADYNPQAIGISYADEYFNVSTIDENGIYEVASVFKADGIMTLATDMPMRSVAYATHKLGLAGISYDTAMKTTDKGEMIKAFEAAGVEHPWYFILQTTAELEKIIDGITYPCISKPVDNSGSRGVMLINNREELEQAVQYSSSNGRNGGVIIEEYMRGNEVSVEMIVYKGIPYVLQVTDKLTTGAPHFVEMGHSQPCRLGDNTVSKIIDLASRAVKAIGIENGPAHVEIMMTENGPKMVELGARLGGDCITTHLVPLSTGIDMIKATMDICLGNVPDIEQKFSKGSAIRFFDVPFGMITSINGMEEAEKNEGVIEISFTKHVGDMSGEIGSSTDRIGYIIAQSDDVEKAVSICMNALSKIHIRIDEK